MEAAMDMALGRVRQQADEAAAEFEAYVREHTRFVYQVAYSVVRNHHAAEDVVQEAFIRAFRHREDLPAVLDMKAWLARVTWRLAVDAAKRRPEESLDEPATAWLERLHAQGTPADEIVEREQMKALLKSLIATLPDDLRQPLVLSTVQEMNSNRIAEALSIPEASVRTRLFRARQMLKQKLAARLGESYAG